MKVEQTLCIDGKEVLHSGESFLGFKLFKVKNGDDLSLSRYVVDSNNEVKGFFRIEADMSQGTGFISDWEFVTF